METMLTKPGEAEAVIRSARTDGFTDQPLEVLNRVACGNDGKLPVFHVNKFGPVTCFQAKGGRHGEHLNRYMPYLRLRSGRGG